MTNYKRGTTIKDGHLYGYYPDGTLFRIYQSDRPFITLVDINGETYLRARQATEQGYTDIPVNGCVDLAYPNSTIRRARTIANGRLTNALTSSGQQLYIFLEYD